MILRRLIILFVLLFLLSVGESLIVFRLLSDSTLEFERITDEISPTLITASEIRASSTIVVNEFISVALVNNTGTPEVNFSTLQLTTDFQFDGLVVSGEIAELEQAIQTLYQQVETLETLMGASSTEVENLTVAVDDLIVTGITFLNMTQQTESFTELADEEMVLELAGDRIYVLVDGLIVDQQMRLVNLETQANQRFTNTFNNAAIGTVLRGLFFAVTIILISVWVLQPIRRITDTAEEIAAGKINMQIEQQSAGELGSLERALNQMLEAIRERDNQTVKLNEQLEQRVTEAEQARAEAERSNQVKSAFLASMSHELRTPLNAVINFTKFVAQGDLGEVNDEQKDMLMEVVDSGRHLLHLINDVLDMSKIESDALTLFVQDNVDVSEIIDTVVKSGEVLIQGKDIELRKVVPDDLPLIRADGQRVRQILTNLMSNAIKFTVEGHIEVRASYTDESITITVKDTGAGIAKADFENIFDAFKQTEQGMLTGGGTGLGLPISKSLAEVHGGKILLDSEVGKGSTFQLVIPIKSESLKLEIDQKV